MKFSTSYLLSLVVSQAVAEPAQRRPNAPYFILAGDSTTAVQSLGPGGGWGNGFLATLRNGASGVNLGQDGATTVSYVKAGNWSQVKNEIDEKKAAFDVYVTIQFGHNDQKATANISEPEYQANLQSLTRDVKCHGATPLLVTPLTRRVFTSEHNATDSLHDQRLLTIAAATATKTTYVDLNLYSRAYVDAIGNESAQFYNLNDTDLTAVRGSDQTHLNWWGSIVFGNLVADLLLEKDEALKAYTVPNKTISSDLAHGLPALP